MKFIPGRVVGETNLAFSMYFMYIVWNCSKLVRKSIIMKITFNQKIKLGLISTNVMTFENNTLNI
jgi:hypothetical protein